MLVAAIFITIVLGIAFMPLLIPYLLLGYMALNGLSSRDYIGQLKVVVGNINIYFLDLLYATMAILALFGLLRLVFSAGSRKVTASIQRTLILVLFYIIFFVIKFVEGYFEHVPLDTLIRLFSSDTQCIYLFLPLLFLDNKKQLKNLLLFVIAISLLFPIGQPFLFGSSDQLAIQQGQGTLRLGYGDANIFLAMGAFAFLVWEKRVWLSALPMAGIVMLTHRSAYIAVTTAIMMIFSLRKKKMKSILVIGLSGAVALAVLIVIQNTTNIPLIEKSMVRFSETFESTGTTKARIGVIPVAFSELSKRPVAGLTYREVNDLQRKERLDSNVFNILHPHNFFLSSIMKTGTIGTFLLMFLIARVLLFSYRLAKQEATSQVGVYLFACQIFFILFALMNTTFGSAGYVFWILSGITFWYTNQIQIER